MERLTPAVQRAKPLLPHGISRLAGISGLFVLWWVGTTVGFIPEALFPSPGTMARTFLELLANGQLLESLQVSLWRVSVGFAIGLLVGVGLALFAGLWRVGENLVDAPMQMLRTMPWAGLVPLLIIWLGIDEAPKIALVAFAVAFPLYLNTFAGIRNVDKTLVEAARTLGLNRWNMVFQVILPGSLPSLLVGLRYSLGSAWLALVFAETVNSQSGLGYLITYAREVYRVDIVVLCLVIYALLGLGADLIVRLLEKGLLQWRQNFVGN
ncbi:ABC transporter permease [Lampropedia hyalina]|nr:ABC transporter permease [Lampropedia hyalina]